MVSGKINYGVTGIQQLFCDAVGQKSFADAGVTEKQQILKGIIKGIYKTMALNYGVSGSFQGGQLCVVVNVIGIIVVGKRVKIFLFQNALQIGLGVDQVNGGLLQTVTAFLADIAGVLTVRAGIGWLKIICRITGILQTFLFAGRKGAGFDRADPSGQRHRHPTAVWPV